MLAEILLSIFLVKWANQILELTNRAFPLCPSPEVKSKKSLSGLQRCGLPVNFKKEFRLKKILIYFNIQC
jgi:hypothetical protein